MLSRIVLAIVVGVVVTLVCTLVGSLLMTFSIGWVTATGAFMKSFASLLGLLAALWWYFSGGTWPTRI